MKTPTANMSEEVLSNQDGNQLPKVLPYLSEKNVSADDLQTTIRVLNVIATLHPTTTENGLDLYSDSRLRPFRKALAPCLELQKMTMYGGRSEESFLSRKRQKCEGESEDSLFEKRSDRRRLKRQRIAERERQKLDNTGLRQGRIHRLEALRQQLPNQDHAHLLIPDGHVDTNTNPPVLVDEDTEGAAAPSVLRKLRLCYCCKAPFRQLHHFYDKLCPECADLNFAKRHALAPACRGKIAVVTGARVKIGYQTVLKLLRSGATVVATSRFPNSTVDAYRREDDFAEFQSRLSVYGLDLRDVAGIEAFARFLKQQYPNGIDILIHNACQTIRRPAAYYKPLVEREQAIWRRGDEVHRQILAGFIQFERSRCSHASDTSAATMFASSVLQLTNGQEFAAPETSPFMECNGDSVVQGDSKLEATTLVPTTQRQSVVANRVLSCRDVPSAFETTGVARSAAMSQVVLLPDDASVSEDVLPPGSFDVNGQQLDLRSVNSWVLKMDQVSTVELVEVFLVNAIAPFVLNSRLTSLMCVGDVATRPDRFIVNVSAMEGKFNRCKTPYHPHTNMAKSALNMLTRTSAKDLADRHRIYMNSVDTGWINDEKPLGRAKSTAQADVFHPPLDEIDAAARILDPIFSSLNGEVATPVYGKFLKDYEETEW